MEKVYNLYIQSQEETSDGFYKAIFVGTAKGHIDSGVMTVSNSTRGEGNITGYIHPQKLGIFTIFKEKGFFISTDGHQMTFQNKIGKNNISFIKAFLEFVLQYEIFDVQGELYQGVDFGKKAYRVTYKYKNGTGRATMTNTTAGSVVKDIGMTIIQPVTANKAFFQKDSSTTAKVEAGVGDAIGLVGLVLTPFTGGASDEGAAGATEGVDAMIDATPEAYNAIKGELTTAFNEALESGDAEKVNEVYKSINNQALSVFQKRKMLTELDQVGNKAENGKAFFESDFDGAKKDLDKSIKIARKSLGKLKGEKQFTDAIERFDNKTKIMDEEIQNIRGGANDLTKFAANKAKEALSASDKVLNAGMKRVSVAKKVVVATTATTAAIISDDAKSVGHWFKKTF